MGTFDELQHHNNHDLLHPRTPIAIMSNEVSPDQMQARIQQARREAENLKDRIKRKKDELADGTLSGIARSQQEALPKNTMMKTRKTLKGHLAKIYAMHWSTDRDIWFQHHKTGSSSFGMRIRQTKFMLFLCA